MLTSEPPLDPPEGPDWDLMVEAHDQALRVEVEIGCEIHPAAQDDVTECMDAIWDDLTPGAKLAADRVLYAAVMGATPHAGDVALCQSLVWGALRRIVQRRDEE